MNLVNNFFKQEHKLSLTRGVNIYSTKSLKIIAISFIVIGLLVAAGCLIGSIITGNPIIAALALPGIAFSIPSILLLLQTHKKVAPSPKQIAVATEIKPPIPKKTPSPIRTTPPLHLKTPERTPSPIGTPPPLHLKTPERTPSPIGTPPPLEFTDLMSCNLIKKLFPYVSVEGPTKYFRSGKTRMTLCFSQSPIEIPAIPLHENSPAIVFNDANPSLDENFIAWGTSSNLKKCVTDKSWWGSSGLRDFLPLDAGSVRVAPWESSQKFQQTSSLTKTWSYLGHMVSPRGLGDVVLGFEIFKNLYRKAFNMASDLGCTIIQMPTFQSIRFSPPSGSQNSEVAQNIIIKALLTTVAELERKLMNDPEKSAWLNNLSIVIVDRNKTAYTGIV